MARQYQLTAEDVQAVNRTAARLGVQPADLIAVIHYETIGTMNPTIKGGKGGRYQGLIQFGPSERRTYGYKADASFAEQVEGPVYSYLKGRGLPYGADLGTIYRTINGGNPLAALWKNDGNGTIAQHIERIRALSLPLASDILQGAGPDVSAIMDVAVRNPATGAEAGAPTALQGFQPTLSKAGFGEMPVAPAQQAIADVFGQPGGLPPTAPNPAERFETVAGWMPQFAQPYNVPPQTPRRPGPGGALGVDLGMQPAGMPVPPSRPGSFDWLGGGAPDAGLVPTPGISPLRPQIGGPGDRRPQPPLPQMRPDLPPYPAAAMANMPPIGAASPVDAFSAPAGPLDLIPYSTPPPATVAPAIPSLDRSILAGGNFGTPETAMSLGRTFPPPPISLDQRISDHSAALDSRSLAAEMGFDRRTMEWHTQPPPGPPPEARMKDDVFSPPGPVGGFDRAAEAVRIGGFPPSLNVGAFPPTAADDPYRVTSSREQALPYANLPPYADLQPISGAAGTDVLGSGPITPLSPTPQPIMPAGDPWAAAYGGPRPASSPVTPMMMPQGDPWAAAYGVPPIPDIPGSTVVNSEEYFNPTKGTEPVSLQPQAVDPAAAAANQPTATAVAPRDLAAVQDDPTVAAAATVAEQRPGLLQRILGGGDGFRSMPGFGGILNPNGFLNNMGTPPAFTPFGAPRMDTGFGGSLRTSGTSPSGTNWQRGTSTAFGGGNKVSGPTQALSWQSSNGQTITAHTDPWTGQTFHSWS